MGRVRTFRDDHELGPLLDRIPNYERSTIIRMALRQYFGQSAATGQLTFQPTSYDPEVIPNGQRKLTQTLYP